MEYKLIFTLCLISLMISTNSEGVTDVPQSPDESLTTLGINAGSGTTAPTADVMKDNGSDDNLLSSSVAENNHSTMHTNGSPIDSLYSGTSSTEIPAADKTSEQVLKVDLTKDDGGNAILLPSVATNDNSPMDKSDSSNDSLYSVTSEAPDANKTSQQVVNVNVTKDDGDNDILLSSVATNDNSTVQEDDSPNEPLYSGISTIEGSFQLALLTNFFLAVKTFV